MYIYQELAARAAAGEPVQVGLISAGKFGSMFLQQVPTTPGLEVHTIAGLNLEGAKQACRNVDWTEELTAQTRFVEDAMVLLQTGSINVAVEATGNPAIGLVHAREAIRNRLHIVMINVEADVLVGPLLAEEAKQAGVVSSLELDGRQVFNDLRQGVYVVIEAPNDYATSCFRQYGMNTDALGRYSAMFKPFHLIGLELNIQILSAALLNKPTGTTDGFRGDVVATAKHDLKAGEILDGEGGFTVWVKLYPAATSLNLGGLPIGLARNVKLKSDISINQLVRWQDLDIDETQDEVKIRRQMEARFKLPVGVE